MGRTKKKIGDSREKEACITKNGVTYRVKKYGDVERIEREEHPLVKLGVVKSADELFIHCFSCGGKMSLRAFTGGGVYKQQQLELLLPFGSRLKVIEKSLNDLILLYYKCDKCNTVFPFDKDRESLIKRCLRIKTLYEKYADGSIPKDEYIYRMALAFLEGAKYGGGNSELEKNK